VKHFLYGIISCFVFILSVAIAVAFGITKLGLIPINADATPSSLEQRLFPTVVRAAVAREARSQPNTDSATDDEIRAGGEIYKAMCVQCHGQLNGRPSVLGASFYPPAPQLPGHSSSYTGAELFWVVKHGIRNTSMPAWGRLLSDRDIGQVVAFVKTLGPGVTEDASTHKGE
jgi:mono/diheme cytochrome c family protein